MPRYPHTPSPGPFGPEPARPATTSLPTERPLLSAHAAVVFLGSVIMGLSPRSTGRLPDQQRLRCPGLSSSTAPRSSGYWSVQTEDHDLTSTDRTELSLLELGFELPVSARDTASGWSNGTS